MDRAMTKEEKIQAIIEAEKNETLITWMLEGDEEILGYKDENGKYFEDMFDYVDTTTTPASVVFIWGTDNDEHRVDINKLTMESIDRLYGCISK